VKQTGSGERGRRKAERAWQRQQERERKRQARLAKRPKGPAVTWPAGSEALMKPGSCRGRRPG
jgi:hypothetical protein